MPSPPRPLRALIATEQLGQGKVERNQAAVHQQRGHPDAHAQGQQALEKRIHGVAPRPFAPSFVAAIHQEHGLLAELNLQFLAHGPAQVSRLNAHRELI